MKIIELYSLLIALLFTPLASLAQPVKLKFAVVAPDKEMTYITVMKPFAEAVNAEAKGLFEIELFPNGALGRNPIAQAQMILDGVSDIGWLAPTYTPGRFKESEVLELPGLFRDLREATTVITRLVNAGKLRDYDEYFPIGVFGTAPYSIHSRIPISSIANIKGKKIRSSGALDSVTVKALGAVPVGMPTTEVAEAISRGTIDGATSHPSPLFDYGIARVTNNHFFTRLGSLPVAILMNRKKFESLPKAAQEVIRKYSGEWTARRFNDGIGAYNDSLVKQLRDDPKRKVVFPSQAELDAMQPVFRAVIAEWTAKNPRNQELLKTVETEIANVRAGR